MGKLSDKHCIAIWGAPGGGKTTLAVNMATILADTGYLTCVVSAADHGQLQYFFNAAVPKNKGLYAAVSNGKNVREALVEARQNLFILELETGGDSLDIYNIDPMVIANIIEDLKSQFTYVIIDCTNYKESVVTGVGLAEADKVVLCIPHRASAVTWQIANEQMLKEYGHKALYLDCDIHEDGEGVKMEQLLRTLALPECSVRVNYVRSAFYCENTGRLIVLQGGKQMKEYRRNCLHLINTLLALEEEDESQANLAKAGKKQQKKKKRGLFGRRRESDDAEDFGAYDEPEKERPLTKQEKDRLYQQNLAGRQHKQTTREQTRAEEEAIRRARQQQRQNYNDRVRGE